MDRELINRIGFMQGRFSSPVNGKIQSFPWDNWKEEFMLAHQLGFSLMEWTIDHIRLYENPLMTKEGQHTIKGLMAKFSMRINSLTGDCFMQAPFYKKLGREREDLLTDFENIIRNSADIGISNILIPLVDEGRLENAEQMENLSDGLKQMKALLRKMNMRISFESDFIPQDLTNFINQFDSENFGITYDIGNSASLGYDFREEFKLYGNRIVNIHVKDRTMGGGSVPLGEGSADLAGVVNALENMGYQGHYILQTARAIDNNHGWVLKEYRDRVLKYLDGVKVK